VACRRRVDERRLAPLGFRWSPPPMRGPIVSTDRMRLAACQPWAAGHAIAKVFREVNAAMVRLDGRP